MSEKGGMVVREIDGGWGPIGLVPAHKGTVHIHRSHIDTGVVLIPESHVDVGIVRIHTDMSIGVWIHPRSDSPTTLLWML